MGLLALLAVFFIGLAPSHLRAQAPELALDLPDVAFGAAAPAVQTKADELGSAVRIYEFIRNELEYENYYGLMKGPETTLLSGGGNDYDLAALLVSMLRAKGIPARFVRGRIRLNYAQANAWIGGTPSNGYGSYYQLDQVQPEGWRSDPATTGVYWSSVNSPDVLEKLQVWVEAKVPYAGYRGASTSSTIGEIWIALDPSFKARSWKSDSLLPIGSDPRLKFDYVGSEGYYQTLQPELPSEVFKEQLQRYLAQERPGQSLDDVSYYGPIVREAAGVLPNSLPYQIVSSVQIPLPARHARLQNLHCHAATTSTYCPEPAAEKLSPAALAGSNGWIDYRYEWEVWVTSSLQYTSSSADLSGKRITILFKPESTAGIPSDGSSFCGQTIRTLPEIRVDGVVVATTLPSESVALRPPLCSTKYISLYSRKPRPGTSLEDRPRESSSHSIQVGGIFVPAFTAGAPGRQRVTSAARDLVTTQTALYPIVDSDNGPFIDNAVGGTPGVKVNHPGFPGDSFS